jgi:hypothetical protein
MLTGQTYDFINEQADEQIPQQIVFHWVPPGISLYDSFEVSYVDSLRKHALTLLSYYSVSFMSLRPTPSGIEGPTSFYLSGGGYLRRGSRWAGPFELKKDVVVGNHDRPGVVCRAFGRAQLIENGLTRA